MSSTGIVDELCVAAGAGNLPRLRSAISAARAATARSISGWLDATNRRGLAPLHCAVEAGAAACVEELLCAGAQAHVREGDEGKAALHLAAQNNDEACVRLLLELGHAEVDAQDNDCWTAAHAAAYAGAGGALAGLLAAGADVEAADSCGRRPLHVAAAAGEVGCLEVLLSHGVSVHSVDAEGATALHAAAGAGELEAVRCLLAAGADAAARDSHGRTPAEAAGAGQAGQAVAALLSELAPHQQLQQAQQEQQQELAAQQGGDGAAGADWRESGLVLGAELVGQKIRVWWHERQEWMAGEVLEFFAANRVHLVEFAGAPLRMQVQRLRLRHERVQMFDQGRREAQTGGGPSECGPELEALSI